MILEISVGKDIAYTRFILNIKGFKKHFYDLLATSM